MRRKYFSYIDLAWIFVLAIIMVLLISVIEHPSHKHLPVSQVAPEVCNQNGRPVDTALADFEVDGKVYAVLCSDGVVELVKQP